MGKPTTQELLDSLRKVVEWYEIAQGAMNDVANQLQDREALQEVLDLVTANEYANDELANAKSLIERMEAI